MFLKDLILTSRRFDPGRFDLILRLSCLEFRISGSHFEFQVSDFRFQVLGSGFRVEHGPGAPRERYPPGQKSRVERLTAKVERL